MNPQEISTAKIRRRRVIIGIDWGFVREKLVTKPMLQAYKLSAGLAVAYKFFRLISPK